MAFQRNVYNILLEESNHLTLNLGHLQLLSEFKASQGYMKLSQTNKEVCKYV